MLREMMAAADLVTADQIGIVRLQHQRCDDVPSEDLLTEVLFPLD